MDANENKAVQQDAAPGAGEDGDNVFDDMDCRPESKYPEANRDAATPDHIKQLLAQKAGGGDQQPAEPQQ